MLEKRKIKAVGFDVDGTLYQIPEEMSIEVAHKVLVMAAGMLGRPIDDFEEEYLARREKYHSNTLTLNSFGIDGEKIFPKVIDEFPLEKYLKQDNELSRMIARLKKRYRLFIITNGISWQVDRKLKLIGLNRDDFDPRIYAYDKGWSKPEPAPYLSALEQLQLEPEECVYIGDREDVDLAGAKNIGMKTIYIKGKSEIADVGVDRVYDILNVL